MTAARTWLITGGAGFVGSHLTERLLAAGQRVLILDDLSTGSYANLHAVRHHPALHVARASITDAIVLDRLASQADVIVHLAAAVGVRLIIDRPVHTIRTNILGTEAVLQAAVRYQAKVLLASTSEVYGKGAGLPFAEDDDVVLGPSSRSRWSYAATKLVDEFLTLAYHQQDELPAVIFRLFNTVGPRQTGQYGMVIPRLVRQALGGAPLTVYGDGQQSRCFLHVTDAVEAIVQLADCAAAVGQVVNVGNTTPTTMYALAEAILTAVGVPAAAHAERIQLVPYEQAYAPGFEDMRSRIPSVARIRQLTGWQARCSLPDILRDVIEYERRSEPPA